MVTKANQITGKAIDGTLWAVTWDRSNPEIVSLEWYRSGEACKHCNLSNDKLVGELELPIEVWQSLVLTLCKQGRGEGLKRLQNQLKEQADYNKLRVKEYGEKFKKLF